MMPSSNSFISISNIHRLAPEMARELQLCTTVMLECSRFCQELTFYMKDVHHSRNPILLEQSVRNFTYLEEAH